MRRTQPSHPTPGRTDDTPARRETRSAARVSSSKGASPRLWAGSRGVACARCRGRREVPRWTSDVPRRPEVCESGRIGTTGNRVWGDPPWVQIPPPPPWRPVRHARSNPSPARERSRTASPTTRRWDAPWKRHGLRPPTTTCRSAPSRCTRESSSPPGTTSGNGAETRRRTPRCWRSPTRRRRSAPGDCTRSRWW